MPSKGKSTSPSTSSNTKTRGVRKQVSKRNNAKPSRRAVRILDQEDSNDNMDTLDLSDNGLDLSGQSGQVDEHALDKALEEAAAAVDVVSCDKIASELQVKVNVLSRDWEHSLDGANDTENALHNILAGFEISDVNMLNCHLLTAKKTELSERIASVLLEYRKLRRTTGRPYADEIRRCVKMLETVHYSHQVLSGLSRVLVTYMKGWNSQYNDDPNIEGRFVCAPEIMDDQQSVALINYVLNAFYDRGFRRKGKYVYTQKTSSGHSSHCWTEQGTIHWAVNQVVNCETNHDMWALYNSRDHKKKLMDNLETHFERRFLDLTRDRHYHGYRNGIYYTKENVFYVYGSEAANQLPDSLVCAKFHDSDFYMPAVNIRPDDWARVQCPVIDTILDYQELAQDVKFWMYALMGKLLYDVREMEDWQCFLYILGVPGSGKGTIITAVSNFFEKEDVGTLSNRSEVTFALESIQDKLMYTCPDVKADFNIDMATFQSMISGESVVVPTKYLKAIHVPQWKVPGLLAGNESFAAKTDARAIGRRGVVAEFAKPVKKTDASFYARLGAESGALLYKCNLAYLSAVAKVGSKGIWEFLPEFYQETRKSMQTGSNKLEEFLSSDAVVLDSAAYVPMKEFVSAFNIFCDAKNYVKQPFNKPLWQMPFNAHALKVQAGFCQKWPRNSNNMVSGEFIIGIDVVNFNT